MTKAQRARMNANRRIGKMYRKAVYGKKKVTTLKGVSQPVARFVKRQINSAIETKVVTKLGSRSLYAYTGTTWSGSCSLCMTPMNNAGAGVIVPVGDGQENRTGNIIKTNRVMFKGVIYPNPYNGTTNPSPTPQEIVFWFISFRPQPGITTNPVDGTFFQEGNSSVPLQGTVVDVIRSINKERFYVYGKKVIKLGYNWYSGTGQNNNAGNFSNNDFKMNHKFSFDITKYCPKRIVFNDAINNDPQSRALWCVWEAVNADGTTQAVSTIPCSMQYQIDFFYKDG